MKNAKEILDFYILSGITETIADTPFAIASENTDNQTSKKTNPAGVNAVDLAKNITLKTKTIDELFEHILNFDACALKQTSNHTIIGKGNTQAKYMIVIDAPSDDDERTGKILSGKSGEFIANFLKALKIDENECYFTSLLPWRPPGNRAPSDLETEICLPFLQKQINIIKPQMIFAFGLALSQNLANNKKTINQLMEEKIIYQNNDGDNVEVIPSYSITNLFFNPPYKAKLWDFLNKRD